MTIIFINIAAVGDGDAIFLLFFVVDAAAAAAAAAAGHNLSNDEPDGAASNFPLTNS